MKNTNKVLIALGAGIAIGGLLGVLFAPRKGADTRKKIHEAREDVADKLKEKFKKSKNAIADLKDEVEHVIDRKKEYV